MAQNSSLWKKSRNFSHVWWGLRGWRNHICYPNFPGSQGSFHGNQISAKLSQNCTNFNCMQEIEEFIKCMGGFTGMVNSNVLPEFSRESREFAMLTKLGKSKPKLYRFQICTRYNGDNVCVYSWVFGVGKLKYANKNLKGAQ